MNKISMSTNLLFFWVKGTLEVDKHFLKVSLRNTIFFGLIPAGKDSFNVPLKNVVSVNTSTSYKLLRMVLGSMLVLGNLGYLFQTEDFLLTLILLLVGVLIFGNSIVTTFVINQHSGVRVLSVPFYEKRKLLQFQHEVEQGLIQDIDKTDLNKFFDVKEGKKPEDT